MKKVLIKFFILFILANIAWAKYVLDKSQESDSILFKIISVILLSLGILYVFFHIILYFWKKSSQLLDKDIQKKDNN